jgi:hypothetical protein
VQRVADRDGNTTIHMGGKDGKLNQGRGLITCDAWQERMSQSFWEMQSRVLCPLMVAKSNGPCKKVSECVR